MTGLALAIAERFIRELEDNVREAEADLAYAKAELDTAKVDGLNVRFYIRRSHDMLRPSVTTARPGNAACLDDWVRHYPPICT